MVLINIEYFDATCDMIYDDNIRAPIVKKLSNLLSLGECKSVIDEATIYGNKHGWMTDRHDDYPTTDNEITKDWESYKLIVERVNIMIIPEIEKNFNIEKGSIGITELFVAKYSTNGQRKLDKHKDGSEFSFVIALNSNFLGEVHHLQIQK